MNPEEFDIVGFWKDLVDQWNLASKCGECWYFGAPLEEAKVNIQQSSDPCCVHVFVTDIEEQVLRTYASTGFQNGRADTCSFTLWVLKQDELGKNNFNEILGHSITESKWETILKPLKECFKAKDLIDFCAQLGYYVQIPVWNLTTRINYQDMNYTGWAIRAQFRINVE